MTTLVYATFEDVATMYENELPEVNRPRIEALIKRASARLTALVPGLPARLATGTLDPELPGGMVVDAVLRVWRNPTGTTHQGVGPFTQQFGAKQATDTIVFDPEEVRSLLVDTGTSDAPSTIRVGLPAPGTSYTGVWPVGWYDDAYRLPPVG